MSPYVKSPSFWWNLPGASGRQTHEPPGLDKKIFISRHREPAPACIRMAGCVGCFSMAQERSPPQKKTRNHWLLNPHNKGFNTWFHQFNQPKFCLNDGFIVDVPWVSFFHEFIMEMSRRIRIQPTPKLGSTLHNWGHQGAFPKLKTSSYGCGSQLILGNDLVMIQPPIWGYRVAMGSLSSDHFRSISLNSSFRSLDIPSSVVDILPEWNASETKRWMLLDHEMNWSRKIEGFFEGYPSN